MGQKSIELAKATYDATDEFHTFTPQSVAGQHWELTIHNDDGTTACTAKVSFIEHDGTTEITEDEAGAMEYTIGTDTVVGLSFDRIAQGCKVEIESAGTVDAHVWFKAVQIYDDVVTGAFPAAVTGLST